MFNRKTALFVVSFFLISLSISTFAANEKKLSQEEEKAIKEKERINALKKKESPEVSRDMITVKVNVATIKFPAGIIMATTDDNVEMAFYVIRGETAIRKEAKDIKLENNINKGDEIEVTYYIDSEGKFIATKVDFIESADIE